MKPINNIFTLFLIASFSASSIFAQTPSRINFAKNRSLAVVKGVVKATTKTADSACNDYLIKAKAGQILRAKVTPDTFLLIQSPSDLAVDEGITDSTTKLEETGDYKIQVCNGGKRSVSYTLTVSIK